MSYAEKLSNYIFGYLQSEFIEPYTKLLRHSIITGVKNAPNKKRPLEGLHVVVDAGNGGGGFFAGKVLEPLGAKTEGITI